MKAVYCKKDNFLSEEEKSVFAAHLDQQKLSDNIWDIFGEWVLWSTPGTNFFYLKVYGDSELIGLGLFLRIKPFDLRASYSKLRKNALLNNFAWCLSKLTRNCVYISFRNLITSNLTRPFFFREPGLEDTVMKAILNELKSEKDADMVTIIDTAANDAIYETMGFEKYDCSSEAYFDVSRYNDISDYLREHRSLKKNLARGTNPATTEIKPGPLTPLEKEQMLACVECSVDHSKVSSPCQKFFEENIFKTLVFDSSEYVHILIRMDCIIIGFHTFQVCGSHLGGVLGGFNRKYSQKSFAYEKVIVGSLDYAIKNGISQVHYSIIDNYTKLRLVESREPCGLYFFSGNPLNRMVFKHTYKFNDINELSMLEKGT
ncbi:MAG: hypothetical protein HZB23_12170 [Deltaproteobacteria bacterium]|nr:hypothetical protein [Deltaproteobacteria bacterium]